MPGVWRPHSDARMLARIVAEHSLAPGRDVLDVFTGTGALALAAASAGARSVTAIDSSRRALLTVRLNARRNQLQVRTLRGDVFAPVGDARFDLILANPPYFPGGDRLPARGPARAWEGGPDGRTLVDRLCDGAAAHLRPAGQLLLVHNTMIDEHETRRRLESAGLRTTIVERHRGTLGPVGRAAAARLRQRDILAGPGGEEEEMIVIEAVMES